MLFRSKDAKPITNKWVLTKKYNKAGELVKYKAHLVTKGYSQRPGQDYNEMFSLVVRLEMIHAILALVPKHNLIIHQMDVKGACLNSILQEQVYMNQPYGYEDGTDCICLLNKSIYGLKQAGQEWNKELDCQLRKLGFKALLSDPCIYIRHKGNAIQIITIWVDNMLLFATDHKRMQDLKDDLQSILDLTNIGEPSKIIGIEITCEYNSITISQKQYIKSILRQEAMEKLHVVKTLLDPNMVLIKNPDGIIGDCHNDFT